jgi:sirohydrochlorin cobaltochelatase
MQAVILLGHGSMRSASGASMIRCAARLQARGVAPLVSAAFLNYTRPTLAETVERLRLRGATRILVQPYFLIDGVYVRQELPSLVASVAAQHLGVPFAIGNTLGAHPALIQLAAHRVQAAASALPATQAPRALLLMAHGTPLPEANDPLYMVAAQIAAQVGWNQWTVGYLDCNEPTIPEALAKLAGDGAGQIVALPYFLHLGRHVRDDLPTLIVKSRQELPRTTIVQSYHLDYDQLLVHALADRVSSALAEATPLAPASILALAARTQTERAPLNEEEHVQ